MLFALRALPSVEFETARSCSYAALDLSDESNEKLFV